MFVSAQQTLYMWCDHFPHIRSDIKHRIKFSFQIWVVYLLLSAFRWFCKATFLCHAAFHCDLTPHFLASFFAFVPNEVKTKRQKITMKMREEERERRTHVVLSWNGQDSNKKPYTNRFTQYALLHFSHISSRSTPTSQIYIWKAAKVFFNQPMQIEQITLKNVD